MKPSAPTQAAIPRTATASAPGPRPRAVTRLRGFTLVEVLVALAIVALSLITASQVGGAWVFNANRQWQY